MAAGAGAATAGAAEDSTEDCCTSGASSKEGCSPPKILGIDLSLLSGSACRKAMNDPHQPQEYSCQYVRVPKQQPQQNSVTQASFSKGVPQSPGNTERTQMSASSWVNNDPSSNSLQDTSIFRTDLLGALSFEVEMPPQQCQNVHRDSSSGSNWKPVDIFNLSSSSFSSAGKSVFKSIRKNISLVASRSFDSGVLKKKKRKKKASKVPRVVIVKVVEGEGVEVSANPSIYKSKRGTSGNSSQLWIAEGEGVEVLEEFGGSEYEIYSTNNNSNSTDCKPTKMLRDTSTFESTFATTSLTSGEESDNAEVYKDDSDIRRLRDVVDKIRKNGNDDDEVFHPSNSDSTPVEFKEAPDHHCREKASGFVEVVFEPGKNFPLSEPSLEPEINTDDIFDLMVFVNNEHRVLEYAPEEFEALDQH